MAATAVHQAPTLPTSRHRQRRHRQRRHRLSRLRLNRLRLNHHRLSRLRQIQASITVRIVGTVTIDGVNYFGDALFAASGETHIYIGGPYTDDGTIQLASPEGSIDFVSPAITPSGHTTSGGIIGREGEDCGQRGSPSARWCGRASSAQMTVERTAGGDTGAIHGEITDDGETWTFDLTPWSNFYDVPARLSDLAGQYAEEVAPFARGGMVLTIDEDGRAFFQALPYLCTGNGTFAPLEKRRVQCLCRRDVHRELRLPVCSVQRTLSRIGDIEPRATTGDMTRMCESGWRVSRQTGPR